MKILKLLSTLLSCVAMTLYSIGYCFNLNTINDGVFSLVIILFAILINMGED